MSEHAFVEALVVWNVVQCWSVVYFYEDSLQFWFWNKLEMSHFQFHKQMESKIWFQVQFFKTIDFCFHFEKSEPVGVWFLLTQTGTNS
jgi:hypothetical protein